MSTSTTGKVLVVEDDPPIRRQLAEWVEALGLTVVECEDGLQAMDLVADGSFDLVVTDLDLPGADGMDVLEQIRESGLRTDVLVVSGAGSIGAAVLAIKLGAADFLEKPVDRTKLEAEVQKVFRRRRAQSSVSPLAPGNIGRYQVRGLIGRGAMACVFDCYDPKLDRVVAVKVIEGLAALDEAQRTIFLERFRREAQSAAQLSHPNIVGVFDFGEDEVTHQPYLAMERVFGVSLRQLIAGVGRLPLQRTLRIAFQVADGLELAHRHQIVHRDVKPPNILVADGDLAKIFDFGVARVQNSNLTAAGVVVGSVSYIAPEALRGERPDYRADQFALGQVIYEMLSGVPLFRGADFASAAHAVLHEPVAPLTAHGVAIPEALQWTIDRLLAKDPRRRYQDEMQLLHELSAVAAALGLVFELGVPRR